MKKSLCSVKVLIAVLAILVIGSFSVFAADYTGSNKAGYTWTISGFKFNLGLPETIQGSGKTSKTVTWKVSNIAKEIFNQETEWDEVVVLTSPFQTAADVSTSITINNLRTSKFDNTSAGEDVTGTFVNLNAQVNAATAHTSSVSGGAIFSGVGMGTITGDFINNAASITTGESKGGAIYNTAVIEKIDGSFIGNRAYAQEGTAKGGAIFNAVVEETNIKEINGDFVGNLAFGANAYDDLEVKGGAIYNSRAIGNITGDFIGNRALAYSTDNTAVAQGGAIFNTGSGAIIDDITGDFIGNATESYVFETTQIKPADWEYPDVPEYVENKDSEQDAGGAIYNKQGTIKNLSGSFIGNNASEGSAIYNTEGGTVHLSAKDTNTQFAFNGTAIEVSKTGSVLIANNSSYAFYNTDKGTMSFTADTGDYRFANNGDYVIYNDNDGKLNLTAKDGHSITFQDGEELVSYGNWTIGKNTGDYIKATVTLNDNIPSGTYYECNDQGVYSLTTDTKFQDKEYYTLDETYHGTITLDRVYGQSEEGPAVLDIYSGKVIGNDYLAQNAIRIYRDTANLENSKIFGELFIRANHPSVADGSYIQNDGVFTVLGSGINSKALTLSTAVKNLKIGSGVTNVKQGYVAYRPYTDGSFYRNQVTLQQKRLNIWDNSTLSADARNLKVAEAISVNNNGGRLVVLSDFGSYTTRASLTNSVEQMWFRGTEIDIDNLTDADLFTGKTETVGDKTRKVLNENIAFYKDTFTEADAFDSNGYLKPNFVVRYYNSNGDPVLAKEALAGKDLNAGYTRKYTALISREDAFSTDDTTTTIKKLNAGVKVISLKDPIANSTAYSSYSDYGSPVEGLVAQAYTFSTPVAEEDAYSVSAIGDKKLVSGLKNIIIDTNNKVNGMPTIYEYKFYDSKANNGAGAFISREDAFETDAETGETSRKEGVVEGFFTGNSIVPVAVATTSAWYEGDALKSGYYSWYINEKDSMATAQYKYWDANAGEGNGAFVEASSAFDANGKLKKGVTAGFFTGNTLDTLVSKDNTVFYNASNNTFLTDSQAFTQVPGGVAEDAFLSAGNGAGALFEIAGDVGNDASFTNLKVQVNSGRNFYTNASKLLERAKVNNSGTLVLTGGTLKNASVEELNHVANGVVVGVDGSGRVEISGDVTFETKVNAGGDIHIDQYSNLYSDVKFIGADDVYTNGFRVYDNGTDNQDGGYLHLKSTDPNGSTFNFNIIGKNDSLIYGGGRTFIESGKVILGSGKKIKQQQLSILPGATLEAAVSGLEIYDDRKDNEVDGSSHVTPINEGLDVIIKKYSDIKNDGNLNLIGSANATPAVLHNDVEYTGNTSRGTVNVVSGNVELEHYQNGLSTKTSVKLKQKDVQVQEGATLSANADAFELSESLKNAGTVNLYGKTPDVTINEATKSTIALTTNIDGLNVGTTDAPDYKYGTLHINAQPTGENFYPVIIDAVTSPKSITQSAINIDKNATLKINAADILINGSGEINNSGELNLNGTDATTGTFKTKVSGTTGRTTITDGSQITLANNSLIKQNIVFLPTTSSTLTVEDAGSLGIGNTVSIEKSTEENATTPAASVTLNGGHLKSNITTWDFTAETPDYQDGTITTNIAAGKTVAMGNGSTGLYVDHIVAGAGGGSTLDLSNNNPIANSPGNYAPATIDRIYIETFTATNLNFVFDVGYESANVYDHFVLPSVDYTELPSPVTGTINLGSVNVLSDQVTDGTIHLFGTLSGNSLDTATGLENLTIKGTSTVLGSYMYLFDQDKTNLGDLTIRKIPLEAWTLQDLIATRTSTGTDGKKTTYDIASFSFDLSDTSGRSGYVISTDENSNKIATLVSGWYVMDSTDSTYRLVENVASENRTGNYYKVSVNNDTEDLGDYVQFDSSKGSFKTIDFASKTGYKLISESASPKVSNGALGSLLEYKLDSQTVKENSSDSGSTTPRTFSIFGNGVTLSTGATAGSTKDYGISVSANDTLNLNDISFDGTFKFAASNAGKLNISSGSGNTSSILSPITNTNVLNVNGVIEDSVVKNKTTGTVTLNSVVGTGENGALAGTLNLNGGTLNLQGGKQAALNVNDGTLVLSGAFSVGKLTSAKAITNNGTLNISDESAIGDNTNAVGITTGDTTGDHTINIKENGAVTFKGKIEDNKLNIDNGGAAIISSSNLLATNVVNNGSLTFNDATAGTLGKDISGTGALSINGDVSSAKNITQGSVNVADGKKFTNTGNVTADSLANDGTFNNQVVDQVVGVTTVKTLSGAGAFTNSGTINVNTLNVTGTGAFENKGTLNVNYNGDTFSLTRELKDSQSAGSRTGVTNFNIADSKVLALSKGITQKEINFAGATNAYYKILDTKTGDGSVIGDGFYTLVEGKYVLASATDNSAVGTPYYKLATTPTVFGDGLEVSAGQYAKFEGSEYKEVVTVNPKAEAATTYHEIDDSKTIIVDDNNKGSSLTGTYYVASGADYIKTDDETAQEGKIYYQFKNVESGAELIAGNNYYSFSNETYSAVTIEKVNPLAVSAGSGRVTVSGATLTGTVTNNLVGGLTFTGESSVVGEFKGAGSTTIAAGGTFSALASNLKLDNAIINAGIVKLSGGTLPVPAQDSTPAVAGSFADLGTSISDSQETTGTTQIAQNSNIRINSEDLKIGQAIEFLGKAALTANANSIGGAVTGTADAGEVDNTADLNLTGGTLKFDVTHNVNTNIKNTVTLDGYHKTAEPDTYSDSLTVETINVASNSALSLINKDKDNKGSIGTLNVTNLAFADGSKILFDVKGGAAQGALTLVSDEKHDGDDATKPKTYYTFEPQTTKPNILYGYYYNDDGVFKSATGKESGETIEKDAKGNIIYYKMVPQSGTPEETWYYRTDATNSNDTIVVAENGSVTGKTRLGNINVISDLCGNESVGDSKQSGKTTSFTLFDNTANSTNEIGLVIEGTTTSTDNQLYTFTQRTISDGDNSKKYTGIIDVAIIPSQLTLQNIIAADTKIEGEEFIVDTYSLSRDYQLGDSLFDIGDHPNDDTPNKTFVSCDSSTITAYNENADYYIKDELTGTYTKVAQADKKEADLKKYYLPNEYQKNSATEYVQGTEYFTKNADGTYTKVEYPDPAAISTYYVSNTRKDTLGELGAYDTTRTLVLYGNGYSINAATNAQDAAASQVARNADLSVKISGEGNTLELIDLGFKNFYSNDNKSGSMINVSNGGTAKIISDESKVSLTGSVGNYAIGNVGGILDIVSYNTDSTKGVNFDTNSNILNNGTINIGETDGEGNALANGVVNLQKVDQTKVEGNTAAGTMNINSGVVNANGAINGGSLNVNGGTLNIALSNLKVDTNGAIKDDGTINLSGDDKLEHDFSGTGELNLSGAVTIDEGKTRSISLGTLTGTTTDTVASTVGGSLENKGNLTVNVDEYSLETMTGTGTTTFVSNGTTSIGGSSLTQGAFNFGTAGMNKGVITVAADLIGSVTNNIGEFENPNNTKDTGITYEDALVISGNVNGSITNAANGIVVFKNDAAKTVSGTVTNKGLVALIDGDVVVNGLVNGDADNKGIVEIDAKSSMTVNTTFDNNESEIKNLGTFTFGDITDPTPTLDGILYGTGNTVVNANLTNSGKIEQKTVTVNDGAALHTKLSDMTLSEKLTNNGLVEFMDIPDNTLDLNIDGTSGVLNFTGIQDIKFNSKIAGNNIVFKNGTMSFGANGDISSATLTLDEGATCVDLDKDGIDVYSLGTLKLNTGVTFNMEMDMGTVVGARVLDVDSGETAMEISMDQLSIKGGSNDGSAVGPNGSGTIAGISSDITAKVTQRKYIADPFADETTRDVLKGKFDIASREKIITPILYFTPDYDKESGWITLTSDDDFGGYNPGLYAPAIASEMEGYYGMLSSFEDAFANSDMLMMTKVQPEASDIWIRPNFTLENVEIVNGPEGGVSVRSAGALFGKDSKILEKVKDWKLVVSAFGSINRSSNAYFDFDVRSTTVRFGGKSMLYHGNFYLGGVAAAGVSLEDVNTPYGTGVDKFNMFSYGFAGKTGYNAQFLDGKLAVQPNLMAAYIVATQSDFTTQSTVFLANDPTPAFEFTQGLKVIGNVNDEWQVYLNGQYVKTFRNGTHQVADAAFTLPSLSVDSYWQYGGGVQKCLSDDIIFYVQFNGRTAGRLGVNITSGISF